MRPHQILVTSSNSPKIIPVDWRSGEEGTVVALPAGAGNYTIAYTNDNIFDSDITPTYTDITDMTTATAQQAKAYGTGVTALKVTLHSGTSVAVTVTQP